MRLLLTMFLSLFLRLLWLLDPLSAIPLETLLRETSTSRTVGRGDSVRLDCDVNWLPQDQEDFQDVQILWVKLEPRWKRPVARYSVSSGDLSYYGEIVVGSFSDGTFSIVVRNVEETSAGVYQCQVNQNNAIISLMSVNLNVVGDPEGPHQAKYVIEKHGDNITFLCTDFQGADSLIYQHLEGPQSQKRKRHIVKVDKEDSGIYICATESHHSEQDFKPPALHLPPQLEALSPREVYQALSYPVHLSCRVTSLPLAPLSWHHNGRLLRAGGRLEMAVEDFTDGGQTLSLHIHALTKADYGNYSCQAQNDLGRVEEEFQLLHSDLPLYPQGYSSVQRYFLSGYAILLAAMLMSI